MAFGKLLEAGLIKPGQTLYFGKKGEVTGRVRADGAILCRDMVGSIHQVGRKLIDGPCNGWDHWYFKDGSEMKPLNVLREVYLTHP